MLRSLWAFFFVASMLFAPTAHADEPVTYTVEPFLGGAFGIDVTKQQFGGRFCPCKKIDYNSDGFHNQDGADAIAKTDFHVGDRLMGFSLGVQVISLAVAQGKVPAFVEIILAGDTFDRNQELVDLNQGIPWDTPNHVLMFVNEYDGWSDKPDIKNSPNYMLALQNAVAGSQRLHYYANTDPYALENIVTERGNITAYLVPTQHLPLNDWLRVGTWGNAMANNLDISQRSRIESAYSRTPSNPGARAAASVQQVPQPNPAWRK